MNYEPVIGLEIHAELLTVSKNFCACSANFGQEPNTSVCPVCLGLPGVLPVLNKKAVEYSLRTAVSLDCRIPSRSIFARKNYFYPDMPKDYQISQYEQPLAVCGHLKIMVGGRERDIAIERVHLEEDTGKLFHEIPGSSDSASWIDFNRAGIPLLEIVTEPELRSGKEAKLFMAKLRQILTYIGVCDGNMEEGSLRCDANVSLRRVGEQTLGTKTEVKNVNSFRFLQRALEYEIDRQRKVLEEGGRVVQETRLWDAAAGVTQPMRSKEEAHDYRYFPEPDLVPLVVEESWAAGIKAALPELPDQKRERFVERYQLPDYDAGILTSTRELADYFESCLQFYPQAKTVSNWILGELLRELKGSAAGVGACPVPPQNLAGLLRLIANGVISGKIGKAVFQEMYERGLSAETIIQKRGLTQITDTADLTIIVDRVIADNPEPAAAYRAGSERTFGFLVGQVMKASRGRANPKLTNQILRERLKQK